MYCLLFESTTKGNVLMLVAIHSKRDSTDFDESFRDIRKV